MGDWIYIILLSSLGIYRILAAVADVVCLNVICVLINSQ